jgi:hypothetical protein
MREQYTAKDILIGIRECIASNKDLDKYLKAEPILRLADYSMKYVPNVWITHNSYELAFFVYGRMIKHQKWSTFLSSIDFYTDHYEYKEDIIICPFDFNYSQKK